MSTRDLIIYGAGGFGREVISMCENGAHGGRDTPNWRIIGVVDDTPGMKGQSVHGVPCLGGLDEAVGARSGQETLCHIAIGDNVARRLASKRLAETGWKTAHFMHHSSYVSWEIELGVGCFVGPHVTVSPNVKIGRHVVINTRAAVGHHVTIEDFAQVSLAASVLGHGYVERGAMIGAHAVVMSNIRVGAWATIAVGTPVLASVKAGHTICLPLARTLFKHKILPDEEESDQKIDLPVSKLRT